MREIWGLAKRNSSCPKYNGSRTVTTLGVTAYAPVFSVLFASFNYLLLNLLNPRDFLT
jgi:hypothetical protein